MSTVGTNFFTPVPGSTHTQVALTDEYGLALFAKCDTTAETQANVYQKGCLLIRTDTGNWYTNAGTSASPSWTLNSTVAGVTGSTGATGATGATGPTGP